MKRPFAVIGITYLLSQAVAAYFGSEFALVCAIVAMLFAMLFGFAIGRQNKVVMTVTITISVAMMASFAYAKIYVESVVPVEGSAAAIKGRIVEEPYEEYGRYYYVIKTERIDCEGVRQKTKIRLSSGSPIDAEYSDIFEGTVQFTSISSDSGYMFRKRLLSKGITATAYLPKGNYYEISEGKGGVYSIAISFRNLLKNTVHDLYPDNTGDILIAMMTGDESDVDSEIVSAFRNTGLAHVLAVSGLHLTLLASAITWVLRRFLINRKMIAIIVCGFSWFYVAIAGFPMSSIRAAIMITVMLFGVLVDRLHTPLNSLGISLLLICLNNPYAAIDAGLLMSFSSTFGLIEAAPRVNGYVQKKLFKNIEGKYTFILRKIISAFVTSLTASIFILPASVLYFGKVSLVSPIANLLLVSVSALFLGLGMIAVLLGMLGNIGGFIAYPFMTADWLVGRILLGAVKLLDSIPGIVFNTGDNTEIVVFGCVMIGALWAVFFGSSKHIKQGLIISVACCMTLVFVWFCSSRILADREQITVYSVGNSAMVLANDGKSALLLGGGGDDYDISLVQYDMANNGITELTALMLTDMSEAGASGADALIESMKPMAVYTSGSGFCSDNVEYAAEKKNLTLSNSINKAVSSGSAKISNLEDTLGNVWSLVECGGMRVIICPSDVDARLCPFEGEFDAAVMNSDIPSCVSALYAKAYIVCADYKDGALTVSQLMARGLKNVYCTGINGNIKLAVREGRLYVGGD